MNRSHDAKIAVRARTASHGTCFPSLIAGLATIAAIAGGPVAHAASVERTETIEREIALAAGVREVVIDNVFGAVHVTTGGKGKVVVEVRQHAEARRDSYLDDAFEEVTLKIETEADRVELVQDGPFRCGEGGRWWRTGCNWDPDYEMTWEWNVTVPAGVDLSVSTVNGGDVSVDGASGNLRAVNVNGGLRLTAIAASEIEAVTVNGGVDVEFARTPTVDSTFKTVNGEVELALPRDATAEVSVDTLHGDLYTDFETEAVPVKAVAQRNGSGKTTRYRFEQDMVVRIGGGGADTLRVRLDCATINGDVVVRAR